MHCRKNYWFYHNTFRLKMFENPLDAIEDTWNLIANHAIICYVMITLLWGNNSTVAKLGN